MRTYGDVVDDLARAVARLVSAGGTEPQPAATLAARTAVFDGLRHTVDGLTGTRTSPRRPALADLELDPSGAFRAALHHLPRTSGSIGLADTIADSLVSEAWARAAAASLELTKYAEALPALEISARWTALGDIADIAITLAKLDENLASRIPGSGLPDRRSLAALRLTAAATYAEARRRAPNRAAEASPEPTPAFPCLIRRAADIPVALQRVAAMIRIRHSNITMHEFGGVLMPLARSLDDASRVLRVAAWRLNQPEPIAQMADQAARTRDALTTLVRHRGHVMTVGPIDQPLIDQMAELRGAMRSLLNYSGTADGACNLGPARISTVLASQGWTITTELAHALTAAAKSGRLLVLEHGVDINSRHWNQASPQDDRVRALVGDLRAATRVARPDNDHQLVTERVLGLPARSAREAGSIRARSLGEPRENARLVQG